MVDRAWTEKVVFEVGAHRLTYAPPDVLEMVIDGVFRPEDASAYLERAFDLGDRLGDFFLCCDVRGLREVPQASRILLSRLDRRYPYRGIAILGASFAKRITVETIMRAGRVLTPRYFPFPLAFFTTREEAGAWFRKLRGG